MSGAARKGSAEARFVWRKLSPAKWEDVWQERLGWLGQRLVLFVLKGYKTLRIEAHQVTKEEAAKLQREFGGDVRAAKPLTAAELEPQRRPPLKIGRRLAVIGHEEDRAAFEEAGVPVLLIPSSLAFGTGEHATTSTCLRVLAEVAKGQDAGSWDALDLGTGSGILAMAARVLGARKVEAGDFDAMALRVARENARVNGLKWLTFKRMDVLKWKPERKWPVVLANVYGPVLIEAAPQIARAVERGGALILSGILREQASDVISAFEGRGITFERVARKGKWVTALGRAGSHGRKL